MSVSDTVVRDIGPSDGTFPPVELLRWPADADRREELRRAGRPRLLLLGADDLPPGMADNEDWIRLPADENDLADRLQRLAQRSAQRRELLPGDVSVDGDGLVHRGDEWVALPPLEAAIMARLVASPGRMVARDELVSMVWGDRRHRPHSLDSRIFTLRTRLKPLGLAVHTIRGRGFLLTTDPSVGS